MVRNVAPNGGACWLETDRFSSGGQISSSIFWQNGDDPIDGLLEWLRVYSSVVEGGYPGWNIQDADPLFLDLASGDLRLAPGSPCIDRGLASAARRFVSDRDFSGQERFLEGDRLRDLAGRPSVRRPGGRFEEPTVPRIDLGAHEYSWSPHDGLLGNVNTALGFPVRTDVLLVNGLSGDEDRVVQVGLGEPDEVSNPAPTVLFSLPEGFDVPITMTYQGFIQDDEAPNPLGLAVTNGVVLRVE